MWTGVSVGLPHQRERLYIVSYPNSNGLQASQAKSQPHIQADQERTSESVQTIGSQRFTQPGNVRQVLSPGAFEGIISAFPDKGTSIRRLRRVTNGIPTGMDEDRRQLRIHQLGNAVIPQIPEAIGRMIMKHEGMLP